jgi:hypothetical protein
MNNIYLRGIIILCAFFSNSVYAQVLGTNIFLHGRYVEVGVGKLGYYGSDSVAPAGYHAHCATCTVPNCIGFAADPAMDGWATGTPPMMGDYFAPGSPYEGWKLQLGTKWCIQLWAWLNIYDNRRPHVSHYSRFHV